MVYCVEDKQTSESGFDHSLHCRLQGMNAGFLEKTGGSVLFDLQTRTCQSFLSATLRCAGAIRRSAPAWGTPPPQCPSLMVWGELRPQRAEQEQSSTYVCEVCWTINLLLLFLLLLLLLTMGWMNCVLVRRRSELEG